MSGTYKGLHARIRAHNEKALSVHCKAHCLNLVLVEAAKSNKTFINLVEKLYAFCTSSPKCHTALVNWQRSLYPGQRVMELQQLSDSLAGRKQFLQRNLKAILKLLDDISDSDPPNLARGDAQMYKNAINFMCILCLEIATPVFKVTAVASDSLQEERLDHSTTYKLIDGVLHTLQTMRSEEKFGEIFGCASEKAESLNIPPTVVPTLLRGASASSPEPTLRRGKGKCQCVYNKAQQCLKSLWSHTSGVVCFSPLWTGDSTLEVPLPESFSPLTVHANWVSTPNAEAKKAVHILCDFYGEDRTKGD